MTLTLYSILLFIISNINAIHNTFNQMIGITQSDNNIIFNVWISSNIPNWLNINKYIIQNNSISLINTFTFKLSSSQNISAISAHYKYSDFFNSNNIMILAISYIDLIQIYKLEFNDTIIYINNTNLNKIESSTVNLLNDETFFQLIWNVDNNIYYAIYNISSIKDFVSLNFELLLLPSNNSKISNNIYPISVIISSSNILSCYTRIYIGLYVEYNCILIDIQYGNVLREWNVDNFSIIINANDINNYRLDFVIYDDDDENTSNLSKLFFVYQHDAILYGIIKQFDIENIGELMEIKEEFILVSYSYNETSQYLIKESQITNAYLTDDKKSEYVLIVWIVIDVGIFGNIFDWNNGQRLNCIDIEIYLSVNVSNIDITSYLGFGIVSFIIFDGIEDKIMSKIIDYSEYIDCDKNDDGGQSICDYNILLSFFAISNDGIFYLSQIGQLNIINTIQDSFNSDIDIINNVFYDIMIQSISSKELQDINLFQYSVVAKICINNDETYQIIKDSIENDQNKYKINLKSMSYIEDINNFTVTFDLKIESKNNDNDQVTKYIIYSVVGLLLYIAICCIILYFTLKQSRKKTNRYDSERQNSLDPNKQKIKHQIVSSQSQYQIRKEMEIATLTMPTKLSPPIVDIEKVDTLDDAAAKPLPISPTSTFIISDNDNINDEDQQIIAKDSTIYYDPTHDAKLYGKNSQNNNIHVIAMDTMYHDNNNHEIGPKMIPKLKTFVAQDNNQLI